MRGMMPSSSRARKRSGNERADAAAVIGATIGR